MFAILVQPETLELITAMNDGVTPEVEMNEATGEPETFYIWTDNDTPAEIITSEELRDRLDSDPDWEPLKFAIWRK